MQILLSQVEKVEAEQALSEAIPVLEEAAAALNDLKRDDITEIRSFAKPHMLVQKVGGCRVGSDGCMSAWSGHRCSTCCRFYTNPDYLLTNTAPTCRPSHCATARSASAW